MPTIRRSAVTVLLGVGSGTIVRSSELDQSAWRAYEAVEETWIRDRHALLLDQCGVCAEAAAIDLELKLAELRRRGLQFLYLSKHHPEELRGGVWQLSWIPLTTVDIAKITAVSPEYRRQEQKIRRLTEELRRSPNYENFRRAQTHLWKTPEYHALHRRYYSRLKELNEACGGMIAN
jgi:hypothetical protein